MGYSSHKNQINHILIRQAMEVAEYIDHTLEIAVKRITVITNELLPVQCIERVKHSSPKK